MNTVSTSAERQGIAPPFEPLALSIRQCATTLSVSERQVYILAERDGLPTVKIGGRRLIRVADLRAWLAAQPASVLAGQATKQGRP
jgi:excisionase family DNA binding protein